MNEVRDDLRDLVRSHLKDNVRLLELEYQPANSEKVTTINGVATMALDSEKIVAMNSK
jgi:hypothetical protein